MHGCRPPPPTAASDPNALTYAHKRFFLGLAQSGQVTKTPFGSKVVLEDGRQLTLPAARALDAAGRMARFGAMTPELHAALLNASEGEKVHVAFHFVPVLDATWARDVHGRGSTADARRRAKEATAASIDRQSAALANHLRAHGVVGVLPISGLPLVQGVATPSLLRALARDPQIATISGAETGTAEELAVHDPVPFTGADVATWPAGVYGDKYAIGDVGADSALLFGEHDVFQVAGVGYTAPGVIHSCTADADCAQFALSFKCVANTCRSVHQSQVASVAAQIAPHSRIVHANDGDWVAADSRYEVGASLAAVGRAYQAFLAYHDASDRTIPVVNESYRVNDHGGGTGRSQIDGLVQDQYARAYDMLITKSAGNRRSSPNEEACPHGLNSLCVGGMAPSGDVACFSSYVNPGREWNWPSPQNPMLEYDREEPDLLALSGSGPISSGEQCNGAPVETLRVLDMSSASGFSADAGTSFAAPAVAAMLALAKEYCEDVRGLGVPGLWWRAAARNETHGHNPEGWAYSTLNGAFPGHPGPDHRDGGGLLRAEQLIGWCEPPTGGPQTLLTGGVINLQNPGGETPPGGGEYNPVPPGTQSRGSGLRPLKQYVTAPGSDEQHYLRLDDFALRGGDRVRVTVTWNSCLVDNGVAPGRVGVDFDLFLWRMTGESPGPLFGSQTLDDNNEGFDVTVPTGQEGDYAVFLAFPKDSPGCAGAGGEEPYAYSRILWQY